MYVSLLLWQAHRVAPPQAPPAPDHVCAYGSHDALLVCGSGVVVLSVVPGSSKYQVARANSYVPQVPGTYMSLNVVCTRYPLVGLSRTTRTWHFVLVVGTMSEYNLCDAPWAFLSRGGVCISQHMHCTMICLLLLNEQSSPVRSSVQYEAKHQKAHIFFRVVVGNGFLGGHRRGGIAIRR